ATSSGSGASARRQARTARAAPRPRPSRRGRARGTRGSAARGRPRDARASAAPRRGRGRSNGPRFGGGTAPCNGSVGCECGPELIGDRRRAEGVVVALEAGDLLLAAGDELRRAVALT